MVTEKSPTRKPGQRRPSNYLCFECGRGISPVFTRGEWEEAQCPLHPGADRIGPWRIGRGTSIADFYLKEMQHEGRDLDRWVETFDPVMFPGTSQADVAFMLARRKAWGGWEGLAVGEIPETVREPIRMYGKARW